MMHRCRILVTGIIISKKNGHWNPLELKFQYYVGEKNNRLEKNNM
jgi:hypothetical protein